MQTITYFNPLTPTATKSEICNYTHSSQIRKEFQYDAIAFDLVLARNNEIIIEDCDILDSDIMSVMVRPRGGGGGKNPLATVLMIAIVVAAPMLASQAIYGLAGAGFGGIAGALSTGLGFSLLTAGIVMAGGMIMNTLMPQPNLDIPSTDLANISTTYSWNVATNQVTQGDAMPRLFGTFRVTPKLIAKYVESINDKQYLNMLYLVNDGQSNSISDIRINDEILTNFNYVNYEYRLGNTNQSLIQAFNDITNDKGVSKKISTDWVEASTDGDNVTSLTMTIVFPRGLFYANDSGGLSNYSVTVVPQYSVDNVTWYDMKIQSYYPYYYWNGTNYTIYSAFGTSSSILGYTNTLPNDVFYLPQMIHINETLEKFGVGGFIEASLIDMYTNWYAVPIYGTSGKTIKITNNISSAFRYTFRLSNLPAAKYYTRIRFASAPDTSSRYGSDCYYEYLSESTSYDFTYPGQTLLAVRALATDQLSGGLPTVSCKVSAGSSNPSIIVQSILEEVGVSSDRLSAKFDEWETFCDDNNLQCHIYFDATTDVRQAINYVSTIGRASIIQFGSKFDVIIDRAEEIPTQGFTFGMGNILKDTFKQSFLPLKDRANLIEISYYDIENDYQKTAIQLGEDNYDTVDEANKTNINLIGCVDRTKAIEHARLLLNYNRYLTQTMTFQADVDSLVCKVGDIVRISHDLPQYGFSGRIISSTTTSAVLDRDMTMVSGKTYYLQVRRNATNEIIEIPLQTVVGTSSTVTFNSTITALNHLDNYSFGEINRTDIKARVLNIRTTNEFLRELTCIEYNESVYDLTHTPIVQTFSSLGLSNLRINDYIRYAQDLSIETVVNIAWSGNSLFYDVSIDNTTTRVYEQFYNAYGLVDGQTYQITVKDNLGNSIKENYTVLGKLAPPTNIDSISGSEIGNVFKIEWTYLDKVIDFKEYAIFYQDIEIGRTKGNFFEYYSYGLEIKTFTVKVVDTSNVMSSGVSVNIQAVAPNAVSNINITENIDDWNISWTYGYFPLDFKTFQIYQDYDLVGETTGFNYKAKITKSESKFRIIAIDSANNQSNYVETTVNITELDDISSINASYSNNLLFAFWNTINSFRSPIIYEIRKGSSWTNAQFIEKTTDYKVNIYSNGTYLVKATYQFSSGLKIESENEIVLIVDESQLSKNVLVTWNEYDTFWLGTKTNTQINEDNYLTLVSSLNVDDYTDVDLITNFDYGGSIVSQGIYEIPSSHIVNLNMPKVCKLSYNLTIEALQINQNFDNIVDVDLINAIDGYISSDFAIEIQISISQDGILYDDWKKFIAGDYLGQAFKFRLILSSFNQDVAPVITNFDFTVDMPDIYESGNSTSESIAKTIYYSNNFTIAPDVQITIVNATAGDDAILTNQTDESFDIIIKNGGTNVVRTFNYFVKGY